MVAKNDNILWTINDDYVNARAEQILTSDGDPTGFSMVYRQDLEGSLWSPVRPVSDKYEPIPTKAVMEQVRENLGGMKIRQESVQVDEAYTRVRVHVVLDHPLTLRTKPFDAGSDFAQFGEDVKRDTIFPTITVVNGYDSTTSLRIGAGLYRLICSNGMMIPYQEGSAYSLRAVHRTHAIGDAVKKIASMKFDIITDQVKVMQRVKLTEKQIEKALSILPKKRIEAAKEHAALGGNSAWAVMNHIAYLDTHVTRISQSHILERVSKNVMALAA